MSGGHEPEQTKTTKKPRESPKWIGKLTKGIWDRIKATSSSVWRATGGQIGAEFREIATVCGLPAGKEKGILSPVASIMESTARGVAKVLQVVGHTAVMPLRVGGRVLRESENLIVGAFTGKKLNEGGGHATTDKADNKEHKAA